MNLYLVLFGAFCFMLLFVGGYIFMFLNVMRLDPKEREFRKQQGYDDSLVPSKEED